ncbi:MAG TPA: ABC transporter permease [Candidatus Limnocylindria bacterium]|nr:ABC transporter permease [Candidatus Limnocylindria bacterium]
MTTVSIGSTPVSQVGVRAVQRVIRANERLFYGIVGFVAVALVWEAAGDLGLYRKSLLSTPSLVWAAAVADFSSGAIWPDLTVSLTEFTIGFVAALAIGIPLGLVIGMFRRVDHFASLLLFGIYSTPKAAIAPLIIMVAGIGLESKVILVFLLTFFSVIVSTVAGVRAVAERHLDIAQSFGASRSLRFRSVILPSTFPFILTGVRIATGRALVGVIVAEELASNEGIGHYIEFYGTLLNTSRVMLGVVLLGVFGVVLGELVRRIEKRYEVWRPEVR